MQAKRSIIVTGGASGIGLGITKHFIQEPDTHITILDINPNTGAQTVDNLRSEFPSAGISFEQCDVSSWESQAAAFENVYKNQDRIDIVFANAGITEKGSILIHEEGSQDQGPTKPNLATLNVNLIGTLYSVRLATYYMLKKSTHEEHGSKGLIVCTASNAGLYPFPIAPGYATSKAGVVGLVRSAARRLAAHKIRINALAPAVIETNIASNADLFKSMIITPMSTVERAVAQFADDESLTGRITELHGEHVTFAEPPRYVDGDTEKNIENFWNLGYA
ncbi:hypothetical protein N7468_000557 [Penicillium chermesinum]|uniref:Short chain dehydrogenase/reductase n=1 Tax=Penicillium chermesinum TaxID=63820 RepID=A0A9W9PKI1_9EURO|nr:uncharacterized protein N7468_000557 [Penicillium chermesinum]KAJ5249106.1 hypothetical protein N7468_000557 [Penicillium chermesinum]KAJ6151207.1 hypothetical protein N7470_007801 [Penicillium chermesinum]